MEKIISECKKGNTKAQQSFFEQFADPMFATCYRYVKNREDAEELMLNGFHNFFKTIHRFHYDGENSISPYLKKIMVNECLMFLRKRKNFRLLPLSEESEIQIDEEIIARISADEIYRLLLELPVGYRTIFNLYVMEDMSHKEIAKALKISEGTSKSQLSKARKLLQSLVQQNEYAINRKKTSENNH